LNRVARGLRATSARLLACVNKESAARTCRGHGDYRERQERCQHVGTSAGSIRTHRRPITRWSPGYLSPYVHFPTATTVLVIRVVVIPEGRVLRAEIWTNLRSPLGRPGRCETRGLWRRSSSSGLSADNSSNTGQGFCCPDPRAQCRFARQNQPAVAARMREHGETGVRWLTAGQAGLGLQREDGLVDLLAAAARDRGRSCGRGGYLDT
jgi:hypothetical protein